MIIESDASAGEHMIGLQDVNFPDSHSNMADPGDFNATRLPLKPELIEHKAHFGHHRLLLRVSFLTTNGMFVPFIFVLNTGAPCHFYLGKPAVRALQAEGRLISSDLGAFFGNYRNSSSSSANAKLTRTRQYPWLENAQDYWFSLRQERLWF